jgi:hypothetical protein
VFKISSGFWVYLLTLLLLIIFGLFLSFRFKHPQISYENLTNSISHFAVLQTNPCFLHIIGGIPFSASPDGNIQANILCPDGQTSPNYLKFSAIPNHTVFSSLKILSTVNNFSIKLNDQNEIESLGNIKNSPKQQWHVYTNNSEILGDLNKNYLKINDVVEFKYE